MSAPFYSSSERLRLGLTLGFAAVCLGSIGAIFWFQDLQYARPTPKPPQLVEVPVGARVALPPQLAAPAKSGAPFLFLHFFNPECPCSRFMTDHARDLAREHGAMVRFVAVVQTEETGERTRQRVAEEVHALLPEFETVLDPGGKIAEACGVYATPQAALLGGRGELIFRGNYNTGRYCVERATEFARIALEAAVSGQAVPAMPPVAGQAYGCELPVATAAGAAAISLSNP